MQEKLKVLYFTHQENFGDILNEELFFILGNKEIICTSAKKCDYVAIGSLLDKFFIPYEKIIKAIINKFKSPVIVWGSGFIRDDSIKKILMRRLDIRAVRGYYSLNRLSKNPYIKIADNVAIGDPGILVSKLFKTKKREKKYKLGIIPHYVDIDNELLNNIKVKNSTIIDIRVKPQEFIEKIVQCEMIVSSSLHGLIVADSFLIPNMRMVLTNKITGGDYKFNDYYSGFGIKKYNFINLNNEIISDDNINKIIENYEITEEQVS